MYHASVGGADAALKVTARFDTRQVALHSARELQPPASLDREGFHLLPHRTGVDDFYAPLDSWQSSYEEEIRGLLMEATGAREVFIFDHTLRSDSQAVRGDKGTREPATVIHNDYTDASAEKRLRDLLEDRAEAWMSGRYAIVNVWRSVAGPVVTTPLACCDATTIDDADLIASERRAADRIGELELVQWNPQHRWFYYPEMHRDEALLLKTFDSARDGRARRSIHTAVVNPQAPANAPPRQSLESRTLLRF